MNFKTFKTLLLITVCTLSGLAHAGDLLGLNLDGVAPAAGGEPAKTVVPKPLPHCSGPQDYSADTKVIAPALSRVLKYNEAFDSSRELTEEPYSGNQCHVAIKKIELGKNKAGVDQGSILQIKIAGCALAMTHTAKACQLNAGTIRFTADTSRDGGTLGQYKEVSLEISRADAKHLRITAPAVDPRVNFTFVSAPATAAVR